MAGSASSRRAGRLALLAAALVLLLTIDDRHVGSIADGRQMIWTAIAMSETGEISQAHDRDFSFTRPSGDAVSRYGMGMSFAQLPAAWLAPSVEAQLGAGSSQPLFLIAPLFFTLLGAWAAGRIAQQLGGGPGATAAAVLLASVASPMGAYAAMEFSEPMQGATFALALSSALADRGVSAGAFAGLALLTKSANLVVAPFTLLPLLRKRNVTGAAFSFAAVAAVWLVFELTRFGAPLASYPGEGFTNPIWDGARRLLVGVEKGLVFFWPAVIVSLLSRTERWAKTAALLSFGTLLALAAAYWCWHGNEGWGPRLIVAAVPLLAPFAAVQLERWGRAVLIAIVAISFVPNVLPLIQHPTPIATYVTNLQWPRATAEELRGIPDFARQGDRISPDIALAKVPRASAFVVYPWFWRAAHAEPEASARILSSPPWRDARPNLVPSVTITPAVARYLTREPRLNLWGRGFAPSPEDVAYRAVYLEGLVDQIVKLHQQRRATSALALAGKLHKLHPTGESIALVLESYRQLGDADSAKSFLSSQDRELRSDPRINVVLALFERDSRNERSARMFLESAAPGLPGTPAQRAVSAPLAAWPRDLFEMTALPIVGGVETGR